MFRDAKSTFIMTDQEILKGLDEIRADALNSNNPYYLTDDNNKNLTIVLNSMCGLVREMKPIMQFELRKIERDYELCLKTKLPNQTYLIDKIYLENINGLIHYTVVAPNEKVIESSPTTIPAPNPFTDENFKKIKAELLEFTHKQKHTTKIKILDQYWGIEGGKNNATGIHLITYPESGEIRKNQIKESLLQLFITSYKEVKAHGNVKEFCEKLGGECIDARTRSAFDYVSKLGKVPTFCEMMMNSSDAYKKEIKQDADLITLQKELFNSLEINFNGKKDLDKSYYFNLRNAGSYFGQFYALIKKYWKKPYALDSRNPNSIPDEKFKSAGIIDEKSFDLIKTYLNHYYGQPTDAFLTIAANIKWQYLSIFLLFISSHPGLLNKTLPIEDEKNMENCASDHSKDSFNKIMRRLDHFDLLLSENHIDSFLDLLSRSYLETIFSMFIKIDQSITRKTEQKIKIFKLLIQKFKLYLNHNREIFNEHITTALNEKGSTILHYAVSYQLINEIEILLKLELDKQLQIKDKDGNTAIMIATKLAASDPLRWNVVEKILELKFKKIKEYKLDPIIELDDSKEGYGVVLIHAIRAKQFNIAKQLIHVKPSINYFFPDNQFSALNYAVKYNQLELAKILIQDEKFYPKLSKPVIITATEKEVTYNTYLWVLEQKQFDLNAIWDTKNETTLCINVNENDHLERETALSILIKNNDLPKLILLKNYPSVDFTPVYYLLKHERNKINDLESIELLFNEIDLFLIAAKKHARDNDIEKAVSLIKEYYDKFKDAKEETTTFIKKALSDCNESISIRIKNVFFYDYIDEFVKSDNAFAKKLLLEELSINKEKLSNQSFSLAPIKNGECLLSYAIQLRLDEKNIEFLSKSFKASTDIKSPLITAIETNASEAVITLLINNEEILKNFEWNKETPFSLAIKKANLNLIKLLSNVKNLNLIYAYEALESLQARKDLNNQSEIIQFIQSSSLRKQIDDFYNDYCNSLLTWEDIVKAITSNNKQALNKIKIPNKERKTYITTSYIQEFSPPPGLECKAEFQKLLSLIRNGYILDYKSRETMGQLPKDQQDRIKFLSDEILYFFSNFRVVRSKRLYEVYIRNPEWYKELCKEPSDRVLNNDTKPLQEKDAKASLISDRLITKSNELLNQYLQYIAWLDKLYLTFLQNKHTANYSNIIYYLIIMTGSLNLKEEIKKFNDALWSLQTIYDYGRRAEFKELKFRWPHSSTALQSIKSAGFSHNTSSNAPSELDRCRCETCSVVINGWMVWQNPLEMHDLSRHPANDVLHQRIREANERREKAFLDKISKSANEQKEIIPLKIKNIKDVVRPALLIPAVMMFKPAAVPPAQSKEEKPLKDNKRDL